jgi:acyl-CoA dehydrogenase
MFVVSMNAPGVSVRPLVDIAGGHHFNEVFLEGVRLNRDAAVGDVGNGWAVSQGTLGGERSAYMGGSGGGRRQRQAIEAARTAGLSGDAVMRQRIAQIASAERILEWMRDRYADGALADGNPVGGSMLKLAAGTLEQQSAELIADVAGARGQAWDRTNRDGDMVSHGLNATRQSRIAGGTHEIQRNLIGERVLRLPREAK